MRDYEAGVAEDERAVKDGPADRERAFSAYQGTEKVIRRSGLTFRVARPGSCSVLGGGAALAVLHGVDAVKHG